MTKQNDLEALLNAVDTYEKEKEEVKEPRKVTLDNTQHVEDTTCDDPDCLSCRLAEYEGVLNAFLQCLANYPLDKILSKEAQEDMLKPETLITYILGLAVRLDITENRINFLLGDTSEVLDRIKNNDFFKMIKKNLESID